MNLKHKVKLFFADIKRKKENEKFKKETIKSLPKKKRRKLEEDKLVVVLDKKITILEKSLTEYNKKSYEHKVVRAIIQSKIEILEWVMDNIYG